MNILQRYGWRSLRANTVHFLLSALTVSLSVFTFLVVLTSFRGFERSLDSVPNEIRIEARTQASNISEIGFLLRRMPATSKLSISGQQAVIWFEDDATRSAMTDSLSAALDNAKFKVEVPREKNAAARMMLVALGSNLFVLVLLLGVLSMFVIAGSTEIVTVELLPELATMMKLGVQRRKISLILLQQAAVTGCIGGIFGATLSIVVSRFASRLMGNAFAQVPALASISINPSTLELFLGVLLGVILSIAASIRTAIFTIQQYRSSTTSDKVTIRSSRLFFGIAMLSLAGAWVLFVIEPAGHWFAFAIAGLLFSAGNCFAIAIAPICFSLFSQTRILPLRLGARLMTLLEPWTRLPIAAVSGGIVILVSLGIMINSFEGTFKNWLGRTLQQDFYIRGHDVSHIGPPHFLPENVIDRFQSDNRITNLILFSAVTERVDDHLMIISGYSESPEAITKRYDILPRPNLSAFANGDEVYLNEVGSRRLNLKVGDRIVFASKTKHISGIFRDYGNQMASVLVPLSTIQNELGEKRIMNVSFNAKDALSYAAIENELSKDSSAEFSFFTKQTLTEEALRIFYQTFAITKLQRALIIVMTAIALKLFMVQATLQERRGMRLLQVLGLGSKGHGTLVLSLGFLLVLPAIISGALFGTLMGYVLVSVVNPVSFGWSIDFGVTFVDFSLPLFFTIGTVFIAGLLTCYQTRGKIKDTPLIGYES